jgi:thioredoxin reductase (NADPH)
MPDWDAVIIGGGLAGLTAGLYLGRGNRRTLLLEKESVGGYIMNTEWLENYPGFPDGVVGSQLGMDMKNQAVKYGLKTQRAEVVSLQGSPGGKTVICMDGTSYTASVVIIAGGSVPKKLGVPGEEKLRGSGVFSCAFCDGGQFTDQEVAVVGSGDSGITEGLSLANIASKVYIIELLPEITATAVLRDRAKQNPRIEIRCGLKVTAITGEEQVEGIEFVEEKTGQKGTLKVDGVLVHVGLDPNTDYLEGVVPLDEERQVKVNQMMETEVPGIFAAGDIRSGSPRQVSTAVGDGATAGMAAQRFLQKIK